MEQKREENPEKNLKGAWWKDSLLFFARVSGYIAGPVLIALFLGKYLDRRFGTAPWMFLGLTILSFFFSCFAIFKEGQKFMEKNQDKVQTPIDKENDLKNNGK